MVYHRLDKRLLYMFRVTDTDFFASAFGMQSDRFVGEDRKTNHSFVSDDFYTILAGRVVRYETPGAATYQSVVELETGT